MTVNDDILDRQIRHKIGLHRLATGINDEVQAAASSRDNEIREELAKVDRRTSHARLNRILRRVEKLNLEAYGKVESILLERMAELAEYEVKFQRELTKKSLPGEVRRQLRLRVPTKNATDEMVERLPVDGMTIRERVAAMAEGRFRRLKAAVRRTWMEGQTRAR